MKRSCAIRVILGFLSVAMMPSTSCHASHHVAFSPVRGGGEGGASSRWSSSQAGIRRPRQSQQQRYPTVEDIDDAKTAKDMIDAFLTRDSRNSFIARVYAILSAQLLVTALVVVLFGLNTEMSMWMRHEGSFVPLVSLGLSTIAWFLICSSVRARHEAPLKWQLLSVFTLGEAVSVGFISSFFKFRSVVTAMFATALATSSISLYVILQNNPKYDLSQWGQGLGS